MYIIREIYDTGDYHEERVHTELRFQDMNTAQAWCDKHSDIWTQYFPEKDI